MLHRRHRRRPRVDPKTEAILALILDRVGELYKTQAVKLPYIVDVVAMEVLGRPVTSGSYESWDHGVVATSVYDLVTNARYGGEHLEGSPFIVEEPVGYEDRQVLKLKGAVPDLLDEDEKEIAEFVAAQYARILSVDLGQLTKRMNPHINHWPSSRRVWVNAKAYDALPIGFDEVDAKIGRERLAAIEADPSRLVTGQELEDELDDLLS